MNIKYTSSRRAFTLIELLVVISIIGMLSSVALVSLQNARVKAVNARIQQSAGQIKNGLELTRTNVGYTGLKSGTSGIVFYQDLSTDLKAVVDDVLKQHGTDAATGYPSGTSNCSGTSVGINDSTDAVAITTNSVDCNTPPTEYAIYAALKPLGSAGYICTDSKGGRYTETTGGIVPNATNGVCNGTVGGGNLGGGGGTYTLTFQARVSGYTVSSSGTCLLSVDGGTSVPCSGGSVSGVSSGSHTISRVGNGTVGTTADTPPYFFAVQSYTPYYINLTGQTTGTANSPLTVNVGSDQLVYIVFEP